MMTPAIRLLVWANVLVFMLQSIYWPDFNRVFQLSYIGSENFRLHQMFTYSFMHGGIWHLFFNVIIIAIFGNSLEKVWGSARIIKFYFIVAFGAALLHTTYIAYEIHQELGTIFPYVNDAVELNKWAMGEESTLMTTKALGLYFGGMLGASGVAFGILTSFAYLYPNARLSLFFIPIPIRAKFLIAGYILIEVYLAFTVQNDNIAHFAHLGGGLFGFLLTKWWVHTDLSEK